MCLIGLTINFTYWRFGYEWQDWKTSWYKALCLGPFRLWVQKGEAD